MPKWLIIMSCIGTYIAGCIVARLVLRDAQKEIDFWADFMVLLWPATLAAGIILSPLILTDWIVEKMKEGKERK